MIKKIIKLFIILAIFVTSFQTASLAEDNPLLESGQINISSDGQDPSQASVYLKVAGQDKVYNNAQVVIENGKYKWSGDVWFNDGTGPDAGQQHVVVIEKQVNGVGYYAVATKILSQEDINNNNGVFGVQFETVKLAKLFLPLGAASVGKIILSIADIDSAHNDDGLWGYRVYRQADGGAYNFLMDVAVSDAQLFEDNNVILGHTYRYKYKILTKDKEYEGQYFSAESESFIPLTHGWGMLADPDAVPTPSIDSISHTYGSVDGGLYITLTGTNMEGSMVYVDGEIVTVVQSDTVNFFTPPHPAGTVNIRVQGMMGKYDEKPFAYLNNPNITSCNPDSGVVFGGTIVEINGSNLYQGKEPTVNIGDVIAEIQGQPTNEKIVIKTPAHPVGKVAVEVDLGNKVQGTKKGAYNYTIPEPPQGDPEISYVVPSQGSFGTSVVIMGKYFSYPKVFFGSQETVITNSSSDYIFVTAPENPPGTVDVKVINDYGTGKTAVKPNAFVYKQPETEMPETTHPVIKNIYPQIGVSGDMMVITGEFLSEGLEPIVLFGVTTNATNKLSLAKILDYNDKNVVVEVPSNPTTKNIVDVFLIRADDGKGTLSPVKFVYLVPTDNPVPTDNLLPTQNLQPIITSIDPATGNANDVMVISGTNLSNGAEPEIFFGSTANISANSIKAEVTHYSDQIVVVKVPNKPSSEKSVDVYLKRSDGNVAKSPDKFTYEDEIVLLGTLDIQKVVIDGIAIRNNDYIKKTLNSAVIYIDFGNSIVPSSGNAVITVNGASLSVSFNEPVTVNNKLIATANISQEALIQFSNALQEGRNDISVTAISNNGEKTSTNNYSLYVASEDDELKLLPLPDGNLLLNYPNPFNPNDGETTDIAFVLNKEGTVDIYLYDIKGVLIFKRDIDAHTGYNTYTWDGRSDFGDVCGTGIYFYRMVDQKRVLGTAKMTIINK